MNAVHRIIGRARAGGEGEGGHWLSVSDLMAGLMMVFLFIAVALMRNAFIERDQIRDIAGAYKTTQVAIFNALKAEFEQDLPRWDADIDKDTLAFEFRSPDVLFAQGQTEIRANFRVILDEFFPRYLATLREFREPINEIRVEGHTSSDWTGAASEGDAYFLNMALSQGRTRAVLQYVYNMPSIDEDRAWVKARFAAVGFSSSRLVFNERGEEDADRSRRVSFRVVTNAETQIMRIIDQRK